MSYYPPTFRETVTVLNRLDGRDSPDHLDRWKKTVLKNCVWVQQQSRAQSGPTDIKLSASYLARVPMSPDYRPYNAWKADMEGFTFSPGDYLIKGEVLEDVTPDTVVSVVAAHRPDAFEVQLFKDNTTVGFLEHYRLEGM